MMPPKATPRIAVLGGGPIGLETALYARALGLPVTLFERGDTADNVRRWGHVRLFSPWSYNCSPLGRRRLNETGAAPPDSETESPTGYELAERYLVPLSKLPELNGVIRAGHEAVSCGREAIGKGDLIADAERGNFPFRLLVRNRDGGEFFHHADTVIDATGCYGNHNWMGEGGIPAAGEESLADGICYEPPDVTVRNREEYAGKKTVVIGNGYSAATTIVALEELTREAPGTEALWVVRDDNGEPIPEIEPESLPSRGELARRANAIAKNGTHGPRYLPGRQVQSVEKTRRGYSLTLRSESHGSERIECDRIVANVGYHPDASIYRQLQMHECYATFGPIDLAASLLSHGKNVDCLTVKSGGSEVLKTSEPNFFILGAKSFGTNSSFLMRLGHEQIVQVFTLITGRPELNLYE